MKKKVFSLMMTLLLAFIGVAKAEVVTIGEGTTTYYYYPVNMYFNFSLTEELYTPDEIGTAGTINAISFYYDYSSSFSMSNVTLYMKNVSRESFASSTDMEPLALGDIVWTGTFSATAAGWVTITLDTPFEYDGTSNLLVAAFDGTSGYPGSSFKFRTTPCTGYKGIHWYSDSYTPDPYNTASGFSGSKSYTQYRANIQLDITPGGGAGAGEQIFAVQDGEIVDTVYVGTRPNGCWMEPFKFQIRNTGAATTINNLDWTPEEYFTLVAPELPAAIDRDEDIDVELNTGESTNDIWQMVALYGNERTAAIWTMVVEPYDPQTPDVWELACEEATTFPFVEVPQTAHNMTLHNDYTLPFPEIPEGYDAVYKLEFANDVMLNAYVSNGADGKVALYTEDFYGEGGPMANNNYTGPSVGGGATGGGFEAMIGDESSTTTSTYFPFHTLWNYSLAENLFLASELNEAGVTTAPMTSLSWYVNSTSCTTAQNNISIWMGNVSDAALSGTSHTTAGMTLVYTGNNVLPVAGQWNEFEFNQGNFAWDGHSNILILCQRNNGAWQGSISWQTHNPGFAGMAYNYTDNTPGYDATTQTYSMNTSTTNRANIIFKSDRSRPSLNELTFNFEGGISGWTSIDNDGDGNDWFHSSNSVALSGYDYSDLGHNDSDGFMVSASYCDITGDSFDADNYLVSPQKYTLGDNASVNFFFDYGNDSYPDYFEVCVATANNPTAANFTSVWNVNMRSNAAKTQIRHSNNRYENWREVTVDLSAYAGQEVWIAFHHEDYDNYELWIDDVTINTGSGSTPTPGPTPTEMAYGPVITNAAVEAGTYYLVASSTDADLLEVTINAEPMPCPQVDGFAFNPTPADDEDEVEPGSVTLRWNIPEYATGWRLIFGSTYYPDPNHPQTVIYPEDGSFSETLANSYTVRNLWNNTNYFWRVEFNNSGDCPQGVSSPIWGFTTHLNIPQNLTAVDYTVFNDETITLNWNAVVDRTFRTYFIYRDGVKVGETTTNQIGTTTFTDGPLAYNMGGYTYYVTAVYDEGESAPSDPVTVKVSGYGDVNGHVWEQDGVTGIAGATVTMVGTDEFGDPHTYNFQTNNQGYYSGHIYAGTYDGQAAKDGYQTITEPVQGNPIAINNNQTTSPIDYILDENFDAPCTVIAEYYPDSLDPNSPYVKVYWGCGLPGEEIVEPFETGDFSLFDWQVDPTYPWTITTNNPYEGTYCMKSGGAGVANVISNMTVTVNIPADGIMSFFGKISCESSWDYGYFYIDGVQKGSYTGAGNWSEKTFDITAGDHTFQWRYTKDSSVNSNDDCFYVDYITFYRRPEPAMPGMTYDFENSTMQGWTSVDADGDGYGWRVGSELMSGVAGHNGSADFVFSQSYDNSYGILYPDNYLVSPQVQLGGIVRFYACAQDANYAAEHFGLAVSTTNTNPSSFTMVQEWTMSAKAAPAGGKAVTNSRSGREQGNWYEYTVDLSAYSGMGYVAIRHFNCSDMFYLDVDDITIGEPGAKLAPETNRSLNHYRVYRTNCYNDGPYTEENTVLLATVWVPDTVYIDVEWADLEPGVYKWGVGAVYSGNRGEEIEGEINWSEPVNVNNNRDMTVDFESGMPAGWTVIDANNDGWTWTLTSDIPTTWTYYSSLTLDWYHGGSNAICSGSYINGVGALNPDEYLVSPQVNLGAGSSISFWVAATDASYAADHFGVFVSDNGTSNWTSVQEWTLTGSKSGLMGGSASRDGEGLRLGTWFNYTVDLSAFDGQKYVAFRHFNCYDQYIMCLDDITIVEGNGGGGGNTGGNTNNLNQLALERESETIWSNCLDKDMYLNDVDITVLLNSADSPEGIQVTFTNYNEYEQQTYGGYELTLDETGFYAFESFRRGEYNVKIEFDGYEPIEDSVSIWTGTHLRYVMTEILYGVENVYVSRTGWAMWDDSHNNPGGNNPGGGGGNGATSFSDDFEGGLGNWTLIDADGDGLNWYHSSQSMANSCYDYTGWGHNESDGFAVSQSYTDCTYDSYDPNNFMVTNQKYSITSSSVLNFWADYGNDSYPDHFGVAVATVDNPTPADFTIVWEGSAKGEGGKQAIRHNNDRYFNWRSHSVDLSAYAGQDVYIAFRHFNSYDQYEIYIDDVELTTGAKDGERHFNYYKVMCTSIDGVPIFNHNTVHPFCQLSTNEPYNAPLVEGEHYLVKVASVYSTGMSAWSEPVEWEYEPCDHWGPVDEVTATTLSQGNHIEWVFDHGFNPYGGETPGPQPGAGDWYYYDDGVNVDAIGTGGGNFWWAVMFPAGSYEGNQVTKVSAYDYMAMTGTVTIYTGGSNAPGTAAGQTNVTFTGSEDFVEFEFAEPVTIDPTQNVWVVFYNGSGATYPAAVCTNTGDANGRWVSLDGAAWDDLASYGLDYTFMVRAYIASGRGQMRKVNVYEPAAHNNGTLAVSGNGPRARTVVENVNFTMVNDDMLEVNIAGIANYDARVFFLFNLINDSRFSVINSEVNGIFIVSSNGNVNLKDGFADFITTTMANFNRMDKYAAADMANQYKSAMPQNMVNAMMMDLYVRSRENNTCAGALPFCTDNGMYEFPAGVNAGSGETGPDYDCLYTTPNPAWYYMRIGDPGAIDIYMYSTPAVDIDFCCWGPFDDPESPCPYGLTEDKVVSCSYSANPTEHCMIPASAQTGEYYILVITNYSNQTCNINFSAVSGAGSTDCGILPPVDIIGFLITEDGEFVAFAEPTAREYTVEGEYGEHEYCVRPIYPGEMTLPDHNYGWSMGCPVCAVNNGQITCEAGAPIHSELVDANHIKVWWGEEPAAPVAEWLYYDDGTYATSVGAGGTLYWGTMFPAASLAPYAGTSLTKVAIHTSYACSATLNVYVGGTQPGGSPAATQTFTMAGDQEFMEIVLNNPVAVDGTQNLWITFYQSGETYPADACNDTGDANNRWVSIDGSQWLDLSTAGLPGYGWMIRGFVTNQGKGGEIVSLPEFKGNVGGELSHSEVVSKPADLSFMNRASLVKYNVYRSTEANGAYILIGEVTEETAPNYYEYIDSPTEAGTYYYQVRAYYDNDCESDPALAADGSGHDYVSETTTATGVEEIDGNVALYPNPTSGNVTIEAQGMTRITVVSVLGQVVYDVELNADTYTMNMARFNAGMYMVRVYTENGVSVKRVTVMQ